MSETPAPRKLAPCDYCLRPCFKKHSWHYDRGIIEVCWRCDRALNRSVEPHWRRPGWKG